jgi:hypothetical protein
MTSQMAAEIITEKMAAKRDWVSNSLGNYHEHSAWLVLPLAGSLLTFWVGRLQFEYYLKWWKALVFCQVDVQSLEVCVFSWNASGSILFAACSSYGSRIIIVCPLFTSLSINLVRIFWKPSGFFCDSLPIIKPLKQLDGCADRGGVCK